MSEVTIKRSETENKGQFELIKNNKQIGLMTYSKAGTKQIIINHTEVDQSERANGYAKDLVLAGIKHARDNNLSIIPLCPYAKKVIHGNPEYHDVLRNGKA